jgi:hypothetical protein
VHAAAAQPARTPSPRALASGMRRGAGLEALWCALLGEANGGSSEQPPCIMLRHVSVVHMDTHMIRRQGYDKYYFSDKTNVNNFIQKHFRSVHTAHVRNFTKVCFGVLHEAAAATAKLWWQNLSYAQAKHGSLKHWGTYRP